MGLLFKAKKTVKGFHFDATWEIENELAVLFGHSGAGKTMTLRMIAGLMKPDSGVISLHGTPFFHSEEQIDLPPQDRPFGYVFQDLALFPHMTVWENIIYGAPGLEKNTKEGRADEMMKRFMIMGLERKMPSEISGGQKQRVALARALMRQPQALLLDEPFSALDTPLRREMRQFLKELQRQLSIPVVLVTHDLDEAASLADKIIICKDGNVIQSGTPSEVFSKPSNVQFQTLPVSLELASPQAVNA